MASFSLTGDDQLVLNVANNLTNDLADGDAVTVTIPNDLVNIQVGKNGNAIYAKDENGNRFDMEIRVLKGSTSDNDLLTKYLATKANFSATTFISQQGRTSPTQFFLGFLKFRKERIGAVSVIP